MVAQTAIVPHRKIEIDGKVSDLEGIRPIFTDHVGDKKSSNSGTDIAKGYLARDAANLYLSMDLADGAPNRKRDMVYEIIIFGDTTDAGDRSFIEFRLSAFQAAARTSSSPCPSSCCGTAVKKSNGLNRVILSPSVLISLRPSTGLPVSRDTSRRNRAIQPD